MAGVQCSGVPYGMLEGPWSLGGYCHGDGWILLIESRGMGRAGPSFDTEEWMVLAAV